MGAHHLPVIVIAMNTAWNHVVSPNISLVPKMEESENLYKLYGYGLCKGEKPTHPQNSLKFQVIWKPSILGT